MEMLSKVWPGVLITVSLALPSMNASAVADGLAVAEVEVLAMVDCRTRPPRQLAGAADVVLVAVGLEDLGDACALGIGQIEITD
jgi:hypothetical protein